MEGIAIGAEAGDAGLQAAIAEGGVGETDIRRIVTIERRLGDHAAARQRIGPERIQRDAGRAVDRERTAGLDPDVA